MPRALKSSPRHKWLEGDHLLLSLLDLCFMRRVNDFTDVFNSVNRQRLLKENFSQGIPSSSLTAQLFEMQNGGTGSRVFGTISNLPLTQLRIDFREQLRTIDSVARELGIRLVPKRESNNQEPYLMGFSRSRRRKNMTITTATSITAWQSDSDEEEEKIWYTPTKKVKLNTNPFPVLKNVQSGSQNVMFNATAADSPRYFLYRAFEINNGLRARRFRDHKDIRGPPQYKSRDFLHEVRPHLAMNQKYASPFMSFHQNPAVALRHAFDGAAKGVPMALAVFRYDDLLQDALQRFGPNSGPYLVPKICEYYDMYDLPGEFTGVGEWLIWGSTECTPVTIIQPAEALTIRAIFRTLKQTKTFDHTAGRRLTKYFPNINEPQHAELFLYDLVKGYKITKHQAIRRRATWSDFVRAATNIDHQTDNMSALAIEPDEKLESDSGSDLVILEVRPCGHDEQQQQHRTPRIQQRRTGFAMNDWRSDTTSLLDWQFV